MSDSTEELEQLRAFYKAVARLTLDHDHIEVSEAVTKKLDDRPKGRRAAIKAQKERKNAQT